MKIFDGYELGLTIENLKSTVFAGTINRLEPLRLRGVQADGQDLFLLPGTLRRFYCEIQSLRGFAEHPDRYVADERPDRTTTVHLLFEMDTIDRGRDRVGSVFVQVLD